MNTRERVKTLQSAAARAILHPLLPHDVKAAIAELVALVAEIVERVETLERDNDGEKVDRSR